jgi:hypothetical protein
MQADLVRDHLFNDLLTNGRYTVRFSCGPALLDDSASDGRQMFDSAT